MFNHEVLAMLAVFHFIVDLIFSLFSWILVSIIVLFFYLKIKRKSLRQINLKKIFPIITILALISSSGRFFIQDNKNTHTITENHLSIDDQQKLNNLMVKAIQNESDITDQDRQLLINIINRSNLSNDDIEKIRSSYLLSSFDYMKALYEDAFFAYNKMEPIKSAIRENIENKMLKEGLITYRKVNENDDFIRKVAQHLPVNFAGSEIVLTDTIIKIAISNIEQAPERLNLLFENIDQ